MADPRLVTIHADARPLRAAAEELRDLTRAEPPLHPYLRAAVDRLLETPRDISEAIEGEAGHLILRPAPAFLALLASLRAVRGLQPPTALDDIPA